MMRWAAFATAWVLLILAAPSGAAGVWANPCGSANTSNHSIQGVGQRACWTFVNADSTHTTDAFTVGTPSALICFDSDTAASSNAGVAHVVPYKCPDGDKASSNPDLQCEPIGGANGNAYLDGTWTESASQNACLRVGPGVYYVSVTVACVAADFCRITVEGE